MFVKFSNSFSPDLDENDGGVYRPGVKEIDSSYADPLGPMPERPKTSKNARGGANFEDEFADEEIGDDLLPE